jgi:imidazole glycerol-phosphate synthase subunit HisH
MVKQRILIIDYGVGNLYSVYNAIEFIKAVPVISKDPEDILRFDKVILPGVGAFENGMNSLSKTGADLALIEAKKKGNFIFAICLGMQMLLDESEEFGINKGLGLIPGVVKRIQEKNCDGKKIKIPHIGWNKLYYPDHIEPNKNKFLFGMDIITSSFYFVHSFQAQPKNPKDILALCDYEGVEITSMIQNENIFGCQFHPEKSGKYGLLLLENFIKI